jgi:chemotaxis protein MotB
MHRKLLFFLAGCSIVLSWSCGAGKKLDAANAQVSQLQSQVTQLTNDKAALTSQVATLQKQVNDLTSSNSAMMDEYNRFKTTCQQNAAKLAMAQSYIQDQYNTLVEVQKKIDAAEADFKSQGVEVYYKDGLVHVQMADNLMYKSGSDMLNQKGKTALADLANVLNQYPDLKVIVLGNTDNVKFKGSMDNLGLSTDRANGVVRVLVDCKVDPTRLTSAGKGKYNPIADNATAEGRAKNRRTDIILNPDLVKLWESVQNNN